MLVLIKGLRFVMGYWQALDWPRCEELMTNGPFLTRLLWVAVTGIEHTISQAILSVLCSFVSLQQWEILQRLRVVPPKIIALCCGNFSPAVMRPLASQDRAMDIPMKLFRLIWGEWHYQLPPFKETSEGVEGDWKCFLRSVDHKGKRSGEGNQG